VHERRSEGEHQTGGERRRQLAPLRPHLDHSGRDVAKQLLKTGHVKMIVQAFAEGLDDDWEIGMTSGDLKQVTTAQPLQPQGSALPRLATRQQQRSRRILAETQGEQGALGQLVEDKRLDVFRSQALQNIENRLVTVGQANEDAVVVVQTLR